MEHYYYYGTFLVKCTDVLEGFNAYIILRLTNVCNIYNNFRNETCRLVEPHV